MAPGIPEAAICVQDVDVQCVLQFTLIHAAGCALHRRTSRVIHRLELCQSEDLVFRSPGDRATNGRGSSVGYPRGSPTSLLDVVRVNHDRGDPLAGFVGSRRVQFPASEASREAT